MLGEMLGEMLGRLTGASPLPRTMYAMDFYYSLIQNLVYYWSMDICENPVVFLIYI